MSSNGGNSFHDEMVIKLAYHLYNLNYSVAADHISWNLNPQPLGPNKHVPDIIANSINGDFIIEVKDCKNSNDTPRIKSQLTTFSNVPDYKVYVLVPFICTVDRKNPVQKIKKALDEWGLSKKVSIATYDSAIDAFSFFP